jgi:hypothetical protein
MLTDSSQNGSNSNLWTHLKAYHKIYPDGKAPSVLDTSQTTLDSYGVICHTGVDPTANITLDKAIIEWVIDTQ